MAATSNLPPPPAAQGPQLEAEGLEIGVVTAIAAPSALRVRFSGDGGHAGALLMPFRNDAGLAAAELALFVEKTVLATGGLVGAALPSAGFEPACPEHWLAPSAKAAPARIQCWLLRSRASDLLFPLST